MRTWLITGASRGIGLGFCEALTGRGDRVVAAARDPGARGLGGLVGRSGDRLLPLKLDLESEGDIAAAAEWLRTEGITLDFLIHNAGVFAEGEEGLRTLDGGKLRRVLEVNVVAPLLLTRRLLPCLRRPGAVVAALTSGAGQCPEERPSPGGQYSYGLSKAALCRALAQLDGDLFPEGVITVGIAPGFVRTDMTAGSRRTPPLTVGESVRGMLGVLDALGPSDSGRFLAHDGSRHRP